MKDKRIDEIEQNIRNLHISLEVEEAKLELLVKEKKAHDCTREPLDCEGNTIKINKEVVTSGDFKSIEDTIIQIQKWIAFLDINGIKQVCAPKNLSISHDGKQRRQHRHQYSGSNGSTDNSQRNQHAYKRCK